LFHRIESMSFLIEFQKQQKALKDAERNRKKNASSMLNNYKGGEHDIKDQKQLKVLKDAERDRKKNASSLLHNYRGGEHDIKDQKEQKALKDAQRDSKKNASELLHNYKGGEHDIKKDQKEQKMLKDAERESKKNASEMLHNYKGSEHANKEQKQQKILKDAERESKKNASEMLHNYKGGEHANRDQTQQKTLKDAERDSKKNASELLHNYKGGEHDVKNYERDIIEKRKESHARDDTEQHIPPVETKIDAGDSPSGKFGKSRNSLTIDFAFGIIYPDFEPEPGLDLCASAASVIIPHAISQWTNETNILCYAKKPTVIGEIATDDWYDGDESIRYKVKGQVVVQVFAESSVNEVDEGLKKVLRRHVSFRPVSATDEEKSQFTIGEGEQKWMRVREGRLGGLGITF